MVLDLDRPYGGHPDTQALTVERTVEDVAYLLGLHLNAVQRVDLTFLLERLANDTAWHARSRNYW